jgi:hypothetical protein
MVWFKIVAHTYEHLSGVNEEDERIKNKRIN